MDVESLAAGYVPLQPVRGESSQQHQVSGLAGYLLMTGTASMEEIGGLLDWGTHPDCPPEMTATIADALLDRLLVAVTAN